MELKFYLNKVLKIDNIENYTLNTLESLKKCYDNFLDKSEGIDPDYPGYTFGGKKGKRFNIGDSSILDEDF